MKAIQGYYLIKPEDLHWRLSNLMKIPNADYLERTGSENIGARLWRMPPKSANTLHKHIRSEEFYFVLEGTGRMRIDDETLTVPKYGGVLVGPDQLRRCSTTPMTKCCGSSSAHQRNWNFCRVRNPRWTFRSYIQLIPNNCLTNSPALSGRRRVNRGPTKQTQEIRRWKLRELIRSRRAKVRRSGSQVQFESSRCLKLPNRHVRVARASHSSRVHAPPGIRIRSVRR